MVMATWQSIYWYERQFLSYLHTSIDNGAVCPQYRTERAREGTFRVLTNSSSPTPHEFVKAGFYHKGPGDHVSCFCCGLVLHNWKEHDNPLQEHAHYRPNCSFVLLSTYKWSQNRSMAQQEGESLSDAIRFNVRFCREYASRRPEVDGKHTRQDD